MILFKESCSLIKHCFLVLLFALSLAPQGSATDCREQKFNSRQQSKNANYHLNNYRQVSELNLLPLVGRCDFTSPKGMFVALLLATYMLPVVDAQKVYADESCSGNRQLMPKTLLEKKSLFDKMEISFREADNCMPNHRYELQQHLKMHPADKIEISKMLKVCSSIVDSWKTLRPASFDKLNLPIKPDSDYLIVNQRYYAVADGTDMKHKLITANLMTCVGLALYNPQIKRGGLAHIDGENIRYLDAYLEGKGKSNKFEKLLLKVAGKTPFAEIEATLVSGSSAHINYFKTYMEQLGLETIKIVHDIDWGDYTKAIYHTKRGSVAIDCRTGKVWEIENERRVSHEMERTPAVTNTPKMLKEADYL